MRPGPVGVVAAAGTGAQEVACLIDAAGSGVSHIIGVGGRDLSTAVGGTMVRQGLAMLARDEETETLLLVAKEPEALDALASAVPDGMRAVAALVGWDGEPRRLGGPSRRSRPPRSPPPAPRVQPDDDGARCRRGRAASSASSPAARWPTRPASCSTRCSAPSRPSPRPIEGDGHVVVDLGTERYTQGRPHPMVDLGIRLAAARGGGRRRAHRMRPARRRLRPRRARRPRLRAGAGAVARAARHAAVVVRVCGTDADPQDASRQAAALRDAGAVVAPSNAAAARLAARAIA